MKYAAKSSPSIKKFFIIFILLLSQPLIAQGKKRIAVLPFQNNGKPGFNFLSQSLASSVSGALTDNPGLVVLERLQMDKLLKEIELSQSGLFNEEKVKEQGMLLKADYLVLGLYIAEGSDVNLQIRVVKTASGQVYAARDIQSSMDSLMDKVKSSSRELATLITSSQTGSVRVYSNPEGALVYINGNLSGETPLLGYKLPLGKHEILIIKNRYRKYSTYVNIEKAENYSVEVRLVPQRSKELLAVYSSVNYLLPRENFMKKDFLFMAGISHSFGDLNLGMEIGLNRDLSHSYKYQVPYNFIEEDRTYKLFFDNIIARYSFVNFSDKINSYLGLFAGYLHLADSGFTEDLFGYDSKNFHLFMGGLMLGIDILPYSPFSLFIEARYFHSMQKVDRETIQGIDFFGQETKVTESFKLSFISLGFGFRIQF